MSSSSRQDTRRSPHAALRFRRMWAAARDWLGEFRQVAREKEILIGASAITFHLFLFAVPFALIAFSVLGYVLSIETAYDELLRLAAELLPLRQTGVDAVRDLLDPLIGSRNVLGATGLATMAFFSLSLIQTVKHTLLRILDVAERRHPLLETLHNLLFFGVFGSLILLFGTLVALLPLLELPPLLPLPADWLPPRGWPVRVLTFILPVGFTFCLVFLVYRILSERRLSRQDALFGALVFTLLFETVRLLLAAYLGHAMHTYRIYYRGYALPMILGFWGYYSAFMFQVTTVIVRIRRDRRDRSDQTRSDPDSGSAAQPVR